ncbi:hypothetical protein OIU74_030164 [Salix koriyanagi]|uniref:Uncharacterized protein n=1 Tax=Salix koriyanagi TaxID=2511006 RepID=A0A9Q0VGF6_9ROSI|nr:hypothetical protein OIU74_030164 [Salix koriyanagi]
MWSTTNMFSCLEGDEEGSAIMEEREQKKLKEEEEEMEQKNVMEMQKKLKKQEERERKQSELTHMFMEALPFQVSSSSEYIVILGKHERRLPNRRQKNQNSDAKNHGEGSNVSERDHGRDAKQPSSGDQKSNVSENHIGGDGEEKFDDDNKDNGAEGGNVAAAEQKDSKKSTKKKSEADDKSVSSDKKDEDYLTMMTLAEYEKELEKRKALKSDQKTDLESKETPEEALESDPKERKKALDKDFDSTQLLQNETYEDDALFIKVAGKHVTRVHGASKQEGQRSNGGQQSINGERPVGRSYRRENRRPSSGPQFDGERSRSGSCETRYDGERPNSSSRGHGVEGKEAGGGRERKGSNGVQGEWRTSSCSNP